MPKQDFAQRAHEAFLESIGEKDKTARPVKDAAAVSLGSRGGKARAAKLTEEERRKIAKKAADTRWGGKKAVKKNGGPKPPKS